MKIVRPMLINDAVLVSSSVPENEYPVWSSASTYAVGDRVLVLGTNTHQVYQSLQSGNLNHPPASSSSATWWKLVGLNNRWAMFDNKIGTQTSATGTLTVTLQCTGRVNAVCLFNVTASRVRVTMTDPVEGVVYEKYVDMVSTSGINDWYSYFFEPVVRKNDLVLLDLPPYSGAQISLVFTDSGGGAVACGTCVVGLSREIGLTQFSPSVGIQDFSKKSQDEWGNFEIVKRANAKTAQFTVEVDNSKFSEVYRLLSTLTATPIVYVGVYDHAATAVYGYFRDFRLVMENQNISICSLELMGLI